MQPTPAATSTTFDHAPALDGLRGLAVAAVVVYHFRSDLLPGGFVGVDVFFVLSGFLLSALLVREVETTGRLDLGRFFIRRLRRLLPATLLLLLAVAVYALVWANETELDRLREHSIGALTYTTNWLFIADGTTYTDVVLGASPLRHMWSLAIEEQFYIVLALLVAALAAMSRNEPGAMRRRLGYGSLVLAGFSASWMLVLEVSNTDTSRMYFGSDTRVQAMLLGVAVGALWGDRLLGHDRGALVAPVTAGATAIAALSLLAMFSVFAAEDARFMFRGGFTVVAIAAAVAIVGALTFVPVERVLSLTPLTSLGEISYGVYLWHWPVLIVLDEDRLGISGWALTGAQVGISLAVATVSYAVIEQPIRRGAIGRSVGRVGVLAAPVGAVAVAAAVVFATVPSDDGGGDVVPDDVVAQTADDPALADPSLLQVAVLGDSVMHTLIGGRLESALTSVPWNQEQSSFDRSAIAVTTIARPACSFLPGEVAFENPGGAYETADLSAPCRDWRGDLAAAVSREVPAAITLVMPTNDLEDRQIDGTIVAFGTPEWEDLLFDWMGEVTGIAQAGGSTVVLLAPPPRIDPNWSQAEGVREARVAEIFDVFSQANPGVEFIDLGSFVGSDTETRYDGLHYTTEGAASVAAWLAPQLDAIANA
ncbi:acyltransferase family protein [Ilumatobacter coccineus]|uniref:Putative acyltransferase n=1 Tax=Ilumatobacter coccineus (strain NBRC 103263 / KCTC 29153 / YM16-304) TaxID=1313172 RepID=A0A6C7E8N3_ILUCY|nr:acyltransferase family protein [Ilumatobacter coccineus]BAN02821.1 putative acyltransferase [Ilumatobacter coccineus YM16-304]